MPLALLRMEHLLGGEQAIQGCGETGAKGHLHEDLDDFLTAEADIQARGNVNLELGARVSEGRKGGDRSDVSLAQAETWPRADVAEGNSMR